MGTGSGSSIDCPALTTDIDARNRLTLRLLGGSDRSSWTPPSGVTLQANAKSDATHNAENRSYTDDDASVGTITFSNSGSPSGPLLAVTLAVPPDGTIVTPTVVATPVAVPALTVIPAFPVVEGTPATTSQTSNVTSQAINMPSGITAGETLLAFIAVDGDRTFGHTGWDVVANVVGTDGTTPSPRLLILKRTAAGGDTLTLTISSAEQLAAIIWRVSGAGSIEAATAVSSAIGSSLDPPSLTPTFGAQNTLWIAVAANDNGNRTITGYPTGYSNNQQNEATASVGGAGVATASLKSATASQDPAAFTLSASNSWATATVAVAPDPGATIISPTAVATPAAVPSPTLTATPSLSSSPVATPVALPDPTELASATIIGSPVATPAAVPDATPTTGTIIPSDPVPTPVAVPSPTLTATATLTVDPVATPVAVPAAGLVSIPVPDAVPKPVAVPAATILTAVVVSSSPVATPVAVPAATLAASGSSSPAVAATPVNVPHPGTVSLPTLTPVPTPAALPAPTVQALSSVDATYWTVRDPRLRWATRTLRARWATGPTRPRWGPTRLERR